MVHYGQYEPTAAQSAISFIAFSPLFAAIILSHNYKAWLSLFIHLDEKGVDSIGLPLFLSLNGTGCDGIGYLSRSA